jgi:hypothetical protein
MRVGATTSCAWARAVLSIEAPLRRIGPDRHWVMTPTGADNGASGVPI